MLPTFFPWYDVCLVWSIATNFMCPSADRALGRGEPSHCIISQFLFIHCIILCTKFYTIIMYLCCLYTTNYLLLIEPYVPHFIYCVNFLYFARKCKIRHWPDIQRENHLTISIGPPPPSLELAQPVLPTSCEAQLTGGRMFEHD